MNADICHYKYENLYKKKTTEMNRLNTTCLCKLEDFQEGTKEFVFIHFSMSLTFPWLDKYLFQVCLLAHWLKARIKCAILVKKKKEKKVE